MQVEIDTIADAISDSPSDNFKVLKIDILDRQEYVELIDIVMGIMQDNSVPKKHRNAIEKWARRRMRYYKNKKQNDDV